MARRSLLLVKGYSSRQEVHSQRYNGTWQQVLGTNWGLCKLAFRKAMQHCKHSQICEKVLLPKSMMVAVVAVAPPNVTGCCCHDVVEQPSVARCPLISESHRSLPAA